MEEDITEAQVSPRVWLNADSQPHPRVDSFVSSIYTTPQQTPTRVSVASLIPETSTPPSISRSPSQLSMGPSIDIGIEETETDDWAQSVLIAAEAAH